MEMLPFSAKDRAEMYAFRRNLAITHLGGGYDGFVVGTDAGTVLKCLNKRQLYQNELAVYGYLLEKGLHELSGFRIPKLLEFDNDACIIVMTLVRPPFVVDFAGAKLKKPEPFDDEIMEYWRAEKREEFGDDWPKVNRLLFAFESRGVYLTDVHTRNVMCR